MLFGEDWPEGQVEQAYYADQKLLQDLFPGCTFVIQAMLIEHEPKNDDPKNLLNAGFDNIVLQHPRVLPVAVFDFFGSTRHLVDDQEGNAPRSFENQGDQYFLLHSAPMLVFRWITIFFVAPYSRLEQSSHLFSIHFLKFNYNTGSH